MDMKYDSGNNQAPAVYSPPPYGTQNTTSNMTPNMAPYIVPNTTSNMSINNTNIAMPQMAPAAPTVTIIQAKHNWSWCATVWSAIVMCCCCQLFGFIGLMCASHSYTDHKAGDFARSTKKRKCAWGWSMSGLVLGIISIIVVIVIYVVVLIPAWANVSYQYNYDDPSY